jgi:mRNA interferase MazF
MAKFVREGGLRRKSNIRPNRIFTADMQIILYRVGHLTADKLEEVIEKVVEILKR